MSDKKSNIVLIGMPASGKSTVGVQLAKWLSMGFIDTDLLVQARAGESMQAYQDANGMEAYRTLECDTVGSLVCENCVIATGGSAVYSDLAMKSLKAGGITIFIETGLKVLGARITNYETRGIAKNPNQSFNDLFRERTLLYRQYADITVQSDNLTQDQVAENIMAALKNS